MDAVNNKRVSYQNDPLAVAYELHIFRKNNPGISRQNLCHHFREYGLDIKSAHQYVAPLDTIGGWPEDVRSRAKELGLKWTHLRVLANKELNEVRKELGLAEVLPHITRNQIQDVLDQFADLKSEVLGIDQAQEDLQETLEKLRAEQSEFFTRVQTQILSSVSRMHEKNMQDMAAYVDQRLEHQALTVANTINDALEKHTQAISDMLAAIKAEQEPSEAKQPAPMVKAQPLWKCAPKLAFSTFIGAIIAVFIVVLVRANSVLLGDNMESVFIASALESAALGLCFYRSHDKALRWCSRAAVLGLALLSGAILHSGNAKLQADEIAELKQKVADSQQEEISGNTDIQTLRSQETDLVNKLAATPIDWTKVREALYGQLKDVRSQIAEKSKVLKASNVPVASINELQKIHQTKEALRWTILVLIPLLCWMLRDIWFPRQFIESKPCKTSTAKTTSWLKLLSHSPKGERLEEQLGS